VLLDEKRAFGTSSQSTNAGTAELGRPKIRVNNGGDGNCPYGKGDGGLMFWKTRDKNLFLGKTGKSVAKIGVDTRGRGIHLDSSTLRTHLLVAGSSRWERREFFLSLMRQAVAAGAGGVYVDDCGDAGALTRIKAMVAASDAPEEVFVLNLGLDGADGDLRSHTFNPFETASAGQISSLVDDLCHDPFDLRAAACRRRLLPVLSEALCWLRGSDGRYLDMELILDTAKAPALMALANRVDLPAAIKSEIHAYLAETTHDDREYLELVLTMRLAGLLDTYGHIFNAKRSDIDVARIRAGKKYLVVVVPPLDRSADSMSYAPLLVVSAFKGAMADDLGREVDGNWEATLGKREVRKSRFPFLCVFEQGPYYMPQASDLMASMARATGVAIVTGSSDMVAMTQPTVLGNALTKIIFGSEEWSPKFDDLLAQATIGRNDVKRALRGARNNNPFRSARLHVRGQRTGEFILTSGGTIAVGQMEPGIGSG
jgi:intracellular multiplication protein IcmO